MRAGDEINAPTIVSANYVTRVSFLQSCKFVIVASGAAVQSGESKNPWSLCFEGLCADEVDEGSQGQTMDRIDEDVLSGRERENERENEWQQDSLRTPENKVRRKERYMIRVE